jgi:uncharacterized protein (DUF1684 family)
MTMIVCLLVALFGVGGLPTDSAYKTSIEKYRADRIKELQAPDGWLAVAGLFWLHEGANSAGSDASTAVRLPARAPKRLGSFELQQGRVRFVADRAATITAQGQPASEFVFDPEKGQKSAIASGDLVMFIIKRGDRYGVRLLDPQGSARANFKGLRYFPLQTAYRVDAKFVPYDAPKKVPVPNVLGMTVEMESPGYVTFTLQNRELRLEPVYETSKHEDLFFIFNDLTTRRETYPAGRFLHAPLPKHGRVDLDFNKAYNPPCAFTDFATCPLPTKANRLQVSIEAGELKYQGP